MCMKKLATDRCISTSYSIKTINLVVFFNFIDGGYAVLNFQFNILIRSFLIKSLYADFKRKTTKKDF